MADPDIALCACGRTFVVLCHLTLSWRHDGFIVYGATTYVESQRSGERVPQGLRRCDARLALKVNESKTVVGEVWGRKFLGYCFWPTRALRGQDTMCRAVAAQDRPAEAQAARHHAAHPKVQPDRG